MQGGSENQLLEATKLYKEVQSLKDDFIKVSNLKLDYFENLFVYMFAFNSLLAILFVLRISLKFVLKEVRICLKFVLKKLKRLKLTINEYQIHLQLRLVFKLPIGKFN